MLEEMTINQIAEKIRENLDLIRITSLPTQYFGCIYNDEFLRIRIGNHSARRQNNLGKTLSFVTDTCDQGYDKMFYEWEIDEDNYHEHLTIEEVLAWGLN